MSPMRSLCIVSSCASIVSRSRALLLFDLGSIGVDPFELSLTDVYRQHIWLTIQLNRLLRTLDPYAEIPAIP